MKVKSSWELLNQKVITKKYSCLCYPFGSFYIYIYIYIYGWMNGYRYLNYNYYKYKILSKC